MKKNKNKRKGKKRKKREKQRKKKSKEKRKGNSNNSRVLSNLKHLLRIQITMYQIHLQHLILPPRLNSQVAVHLLQGIICFHRGMICHQLQVPVNPHYWHLDVQGHVHHYRIAMASILECDLF